MDRAMVRFTRRELREALGWGDTQLKVHLARLVDLELVAAHRAEHGPGFVYELAWHGQGTDGSRFVIGLTDPATLAYDTNRSGSGNGRSAPVGARSGGGRPPVGLTLSMRMRRPTATTTPPTTRTRRSALLPAPTMTPS
ncbi:MAG: hypothetical protein ACRD0U_07050 [Acidimicrobiales bacterium]